MVIPKPLVYASAAATTIGVGYLIKDQLNGQIYKGDEKLNNKIVIVTGANSGIGKATATNLAKLNAKVIMACRDMKKCEEARREIVVDTKNKYVYCRPCDLASFESIRNFVDTFKKENENLHILVNNAGVMRCPKSFTKEGIEMQLGVNHMGHFLLTNLLLDVLKKSAPSRIINISSRAHRTGEINVKDLNSTEDYDPAKAYAQSKLANILFTKELANKLKGTGVTVNAVHPGIVDTDIVRHMSVYKNIITRTFLNIGSFLLIKSPDRGSQTVLYAALDPSLADVSGLYFSNCDVDEVSENAKNDELAKWLWLVSERWTRLYVSSKNVEEKGS